MTLQSLIDAITEVCPDTYELAFPKGLNRGVAWHRYNRETLRGDDQTLISFPRVQFDVLWRDADDSLADDVMAVLDANMIPYTQQDIYYDESYERMRCILQATVV